jgi:hypothetical protein
MDVLTRYRALVAEEMVARPFAFGNDFCSPLTANDALWSG